MPRDSLSKQDRCGGEVSKKADAFCSPLVLKMTSLLEIGPEFQYRKEVVFP